MYDESMTFIQIVEHGRRVEHDGIELPILTITCLERDVFTLVHFYIHGGVLEPEDIKGLRPPLLNGQKGVVTSGRGPVWLHGFLLHAYHPTAWEACYDPRKGAVVVASHCANQKVMDIIFKDTLTNLSSDIENFVRRGKYEDLKFRYHRSI